MPPPATLPISPTITLGSLLSALQARLVDGTTFWTAAELTGCIQEAIRTWNAASGYFRARGVFATTAGESFYDLTVEIPSLLGYSVTDRDLVTAIQYHLLEPPTPTAWTGTDMFTLEEVMGALRRRRDQFHAETGIALLRYSPDVAPPPVGRIVLQDNVIDVRRASWLSAAGARTHLWRVDEDQLNAYLRGWSVNPDTPATYSVAGVPARWMQLAPIPLDAGKLDLLVTAAGVELDPAAAHPGVVLGVPDDFAWVVKFGALAELLAKEGEARDPLRSDYCEKRWREGVSLARIAGGVIQAEINGVPVQPSSIHDLDCGVPGWENVQGEPTDVATAGLNYVAVRKVPDGVYSVTLDVVRKAPVPTVLEETIPVGREEADAILGYGQHLASFKMAGAEFQATTLLYERMMRMAALYNDRMRAWQESADAPAAQQIREARQRPRRNSDRKLEALEYATP